MIEVTIAGMSCDHCVQHVRQALSALAGVAEVAVDLQAGTARVQASSGVGDAQIRAALEEEGYAVTAIKRV